MISIKNVSKFYGEKKALDDVSFEVKTGDIFASIGHNGAGKSTLMNQIGGIDKPTSGSVKIEDKEMDGEVL